MRFVYDEIPPLPPGWKRVADHKERWERLRQEALEVARQSARSLVEKYGARRVWLYGSATGERVFHDESDIDLCVEGLEDPVLTRAEGELQDRTRFVLDIRPKWLFPDPEWSRLIPKPVLLAERRDEPASGS